MTNEYITIELPYRLRLGKTEKSKLYTLNVNQANNWHYHTKNELKQKYHALVKELLSGKSYKNCTYEIHYAFYKWQNRSCDARNYIDIVDKFLLDGLQEAGVFENDDDNHYVGGSWETKGYKKNHWFIEATIKIIKN